MDGRSKREIQDGEDLASDGERKDESVRLTLACGVGHGVNGMPFTGRAVFPLAHVPDSMPGGRAACLLSS